MSAEFELLRFEAAAAGAAVAVIELDGRFTGPAPARVRLLIERAGHGVEVPAIRSGGEEPWSARFAIALDDVVDERTEYALAPGRGPLIALPAPSVAGSPDEDRYLRLAREVNDLRHRLGEATDAAAELPGIRAELAVVRGRLDAASAAASAAESERDEAVRAREAAESEQASLHDELRETRSRLTDTERERAALRARAESADRAVSELTNRIEALETRAREAEEKVVAAEDETRLARRDLRDTRARLESLLREQRHHEPARRGHEVPETDPAPDPTEVLETRKIVPAEEPGSEPGDDAPRTTATATRATRAVRIWDEPADELTDEDRASRHVPEPLDPARVGAGSIEPSHTRPPGLTPARIMVGIALLLLVAALVAIVLGAGLVD